MTVSPPTLYWYQLTSGTLSPAYWGQLDTCVRSLCTENSITPQTAPWYSTIAGTLNTAWIIQIDTKVRALCTALSVTATMGSPVNLITGTQTANYYAALDATVRALCAASGAYHASAVRFLGVTTPSDCYYISDNIQTSDSPFGLISYWYLSAVGRLHNLIQVLGEDQYSLDGLNSATRMDTDWWSRPGPYKHFDFHCDQPGNGTGWHHMLIGIDTNHAAGAKIGKMTVDGVPATVTVTSDLGVAFSIEWAADPTNHILGINSTTLPNDGQDFSLADFYFAMGQYADVSDSAVIAKFRDPSTGKPIYLGATGELPTGTSPTMFFSGNAATFGTNKGTGGNFTQHVSGGGSITDAATSPSD